MKLLFGVCLLVAGIGITVASCGPQRDFCPTNNPIPTDLTCHPNLDAATGMAGMTGSMCDGPQYNCNGTIQCTPCGT